MLAPDGGKLKRVSLAESGAGGSLLVKLANPPGVDAGKTGLFGDEEPPETG